MNLCLRRKAYYNENSPYAAQFLRNLIAKGLIADGEVDERSITEVRPRDLRGYRQCHFFGGLGGWSYALRLAGVPDDWPVWTGSCPCGPWSTAGGQGGFSDERHLWPVWFDLLRECRPSVVFGEQVEAAIRWGWMDAVQGDLEGEAYAVGFAVLGAHSVKAPHRRQRIFWVADANEQLGERDGSRGRGAGAAEADSQGRYPVELPRRRGAPGGLGHADNPGQREEQIGHEGDLALGEPSSPGGLVHPDHEGQREEHLQRRPGQPGAAGGMDDADRPRLERSAGQGVQESGDGFASAGETFWDDCEWIPCRDGKTRPIERGTLPLSDGVPQRMGKLRAYANAIVPQAAAAFIKAFLSAKEGAGCLACMDGVEEIDENA